MKKEQKQKKGKVQETEEQLPPDQQARLDLYDWIQSLMVALVICVSLFIFAVRVIDVSGSSMVPTLRDGDKMIVSDLFYKPKYGDIVVFKTDQYDPDRALVKRVIATEGQTVDLIDGYVYVDGERLDEPYTLGKPSDPLIKQMPGIEPITYPLTVPEGCIWVMGDNRTNSADSRYFGPVEKSSITSRAMFTFWPLSDARML